MKWLENFKKSALHRSQVEVSGGTRTQTQKNLGVKAKVSVKTNLQKIVLRFLKQFFVNLSLWKCLYA